ncbi:MAG: DUF4760 domain-containing protein [Promethearchaeota archaeon]
MSKPTKDDASIMLQIIAMMKGDKEYQKAEKWSFVEFKAKDYEDFKKKYPMGSEGYGYMMSLLSYGELIGSFVNNELLSEDLVFDLYGNMLWDKAEDIVHGLRKDWGRPRLHENYEVCAKKYPMWAEEHPPKL